MSFRQGFKEKLEIVKRAGLKPGKDSVRLLNSVNSKNLRRKKS